MATIDLKDAYISIPIHTHDRKYLRFIWENSGYEFSCLPFGYSLAPRTFTKILKPVYAWLRFRGIRVVFYIDDTLVIGETREQCSPHAREVCELLSRLGFTVNFEKSHLMPSRVISFLGFLINSESMTISLPQVKVDKIVNNCKGLLENPSPSIREVARVFGLLVSSFRAVRYMKLFYRSIELCKSDPLSDGASYEDKASLSSQARSDLQWVVDSLANNNGAR